MFNRKPEKLALIIAIASALIVLLVLLADLIFAYQRDLKAAEKRLKQFTVMMAEYNARAFEAIDLLTNEIATDLSSGNSNWTEWTAVRGWEYVAQRHSGALPHLRSLIIFDRHGDQRFISSYFPAPLMNVKDRPYFAALEKGAHRAVFGPYIGRNSGKYSYAIARRLSSPDKGFTGLTLASIEPAFMQDFCWANRLSDDFDAVLINRQDEIIASCRPSDTGHRSGVLGQRAGDVLFEGRPAGLIPDSGLARGKALLMAVTPVPGFPELRMLAILPEEAALADWQARALEVGTLGVLLSLTLLLGTRMMRRQLRDLRVMADALAENRDQLETRVQEATASLAREKDAAERANTAKSRFLAAASHDLRQPLHALSLFSTDLLRQSASGQLREVSRITEQINASTHALGEMLNALLDISRLDINGIKPEIKSFPLEAIFKRLHTAFHRQADAHQLRLRFHPTRRVLLSDPRLLERMLGNLIANALRYTPAGGSVLIGARQQGDKVRIEVRDSGIGISQENRSAIFSEFFQVANSAREMDGGLGLGLSIVERLARGLDIEISLRSNIGQGSTFSLLLACGTLDSGEPPSRQPDGNLPGIHFIGTSDDLNTCRQWIEGWEYPYSSGDGNPQEIAQLHEKSVIVCDAAALPTDLIMPSGVSLIVLDASPEARLPPGAHRLSLPIRPARLRALLRSTALHQANAEDA